MLFKSKWCKYCFDEAVKSEQLVQEHELPVPNAVTDSVLDQWNVFVCKGYTEETLAGRNVYTVTPGSTTTTNAEETTLSKLPWPLPN